MKHYVSMWVVPLLLASLGAGTLLTAAKPKSSLHHATNTVKEAGWIKLRNGRKIAYRALTSDKNGLSLTNKTGGKGVAWQNVKPDSLPDAVRKDHSRFVIGCLKKAHAQYTAGRFHKSYRYYNYVKAQGAYLTAADKDLPCYEDFDKKSAGRVFYNGAWTSLDQAMTDKGYTKSRGRWLTQRQFKAREKKRDHIADSKVQRDAAAEKRKSQWQNELARSKAKQAQTEGRNAAVADAIPKIHMEKGDHFGILGSGNDETFRILKKKKKYDTKNLPEDKKMCRRCAGTGETIFRPLGGEPVISKCKTCNGIGLLDKFITKK